MKLKNWYLHNDFLIEKVKLKFIRNLNVGLWVQNLSRLHEYKSLYGAPN